MAVPGVKASRDELIGFGLAGGGLVGLALLAPGLASLTGGPPPLRMLLGWGAYFAVPALLLGGGALAFAGKLGWQVRWRAVLCGELLFLALLGFWHANTAQPWIAATVGRGGGVLGWSIAQAIADLLGMTAARLITLAGALAAGAGLWLALPEDWTRGARVFVAAETGRVRTAGEALSSRIRQLGRTVAVAIPKPAPRLPEPRAARWALRWPPAFLSALLAEISPRDWAARARSALGRLRAPAAAPDAAPPPQASAAGRTTTPQAEPAKPIKPVKARKADDGSQRRSRGSSPLAPRPDWLPQLDLLRQDQANGSSGADVRQRAQLLKQTLAEFGVPVEVVSIKEGPTVTQFGLEPGEIVRELRSGEVLRRRVPVSSILRLNNDLALALAAPTIRIEAPVPGRPYVGVEVPNPAKTLVSLRNILEAKEFAKVGSPLTVALGRDVSGDPVVADLTRMPHLLIAGSTGSGKSVCINALICSLLMSNAPETVRLLMVDPKMVELPVYNGIPHLLGPVITDPAHAAGALAWLLLQMDDRYRTFADAGVRNIVEYNRKISHRRDVQPLPYIVLVIDELADLMMTAADDIERQVCRLAQMARATGIHLALATQRPSVDVITGLIKANFPARIAFAVTTQIDSRVILDTPGAEKLLGRGDMLFMAPDSSKLSRIQGCFVSDQEIDRIVDFWKHRADAADGAMPQIAPWEGLLDQAEDGRDELLEQALALLQTKSHISTSLLQRQLRIGFPRAARLMEQLEEMGAVGTDEGGGRSREVRRSMQGDAE